MMEVSNQEITSNEEVAQEIANLENQIAPGNNEAAEAVPVPAAKPVPAVPVPAAEPVPAALMPAAGLVPAVVAPPAANNRAPNRQNAVAPVNYNARRRGNRAGRRRYNPYEHNLKRMAQCMADFFLEKMKEAKQEQNRRD